MCLQKKIIINKAGVVKKKENEVIERESERERERGGNDRKRS